jgi:excisionase family DNA binding protein
MPGDQLTPKEAAALLGVSTMTILRYTATGKLKADRLPSGHRRIPRAEVERLIREGKGKG